MKKSYHYICNAKLLNIFTIAKNLIILKINHFKIKHLMLLNYIKKQNRKEKDITIKKYY